MEGGVKQISIPVMGKVDTGRRMEQKQPWFKRLQRFKAGVKARISLFQRKFGLKRSLMRGSPGVEIWVGQGIFAHNLWQAARIIFDIGEEANASDRVKIGGQVRRYLLGPLFRLFQGD